MSSPFGASALAATITTMIAIMILASSAALAEDPAANVHSTKTAPWEINTQIRLNQLGFHPASSKLAVLLAEENPGKFFVRNAASEQVIYQGEWQKSAETSWGGSAAWQADFSELERPGRYYIEADFLDADVLERGSLEGESRAPSARPSHVFHIDQNVFDTLATASLKAFYFQRASVAIEGDYAGPWARAAGHPDDKVRIHPSAATPERPADSLVAAPKGWYDAGDYNKYVVNSGITMGTLMSAFERYPEYFSAQSLNIPESENALPDILDEVLYNLEWMAAMQDQDGGVYHKLTSANFEGMVAAHRAVQPRYMVQKTTAATLDFAAVMAQAARVFAPYFPDKTVDYLHAAQQAWHWAKSHPDVHYQQEHLNQQFDPDITTGAYGDEQLDDERFWAAAELYLATKNEHYWRVLATSTADYQLPSWADVRWLGYYSLLAHKDRLPEDSSIWRSTAEQSLVRAARSLQKAGRRNAFRVPMVSDPAFFVWGSNAVAANQGILFLEAFRITSDSDFLRSAEDTRDYLLGRNATGYSYVTGFGHKSPQHPHHRLAAAKPDLPPLPGFLVGGPNPAQQDGCGYTGKVADESFTDDVCSYASNEIAINWNAPFAYLINGLHAIERKHSTSCPHH